jgi:hypothetical protein
MKFVMLALVVLLSGCCKNILPDPMPVPVKRPWPEIPEELKKSCPNLKIVPNTTQLSIVIDVVSDNYAEYYKCRALVDGWNKWYDKEKESYNTLK